MANKNFSVIIYILSSILVLTLSLFIYTIIRNNPNLKADDELTLSKYNAEKVYNDYTDKPSKIATYTNTNNDPFSVGLSSADVVLEFLSNSYGITYKAIFNEDEAKNISSRVTLEEYSNSYLPKFNFSKDTLITPTSGSNATSIFITFNDDASSNFLYENGEYYHYRGLQVDKDNNTPVKLSNVIVQFINGNITNDETLTLSENYGDGLLFRGGKVSQIKWSRQKYSEISLKTETGGEVLLNPGATWWIFVNKDRSVAYD
ncbi:DUF3048 C-terminal domain-containing protein [Clostridium sp.]|uniref:DUF3048 C-terminal domain-containing protein n=1 Tax=Clostridium sp. TaxID=1506 RepID=UPI001A48A01D|nr:DUF3048 C-terminal domain-containing protein [Clostridium sp.]MBK5240853.1 DUF3048 C-terminal domain-containing protein [Clostridium sp.]